MECLCVRNRKEAKDTVSDYFINGNFLCNILEDKDRGLTSDMTVEEILKIKVQNETAMPTGRYRIVLDWSERFQRIMPHILDVKGFSGIRQHPGNFDGNTDGCQLTGDYSHEDWITHSQVEFDVYMDILKRAFDRGEEIWLTIKTDYK